jgi:hypothetical protein
MNCICVTTTHDNCEYLRRRDHGHICWCEMSDRPSRRVAAGKKTDSDALLQENNSRKLWNAAASGRTREMQRWLALLLDGGPVHLRATSTCTNNMPILMAAITRPLDDKGDGASVLAAVTMLLAAGVDVTSTDSNDETAMHVACRGRRVGTWSGEPFDCALRTHTGSLELVQLLLDNNADPLALNYHGESPIFYAYSARVAQILVEKAGVNVNTTMAETGRTALHSSACSPDRVDVMAYLLGKGAHIDAQDVQGWTALHFAVRFNNVDCVNLLLDRGASMHMYTTGGDNWHLGPSDRQLLAVDLTGYQTDAGMIIHNEVRRRLMCEAVMMGLKPRNGEKSSIRYLDEEIAREILRAAALTR